MSVKLSMLPWKKRKHLRGRLGSRATQEALYSTSAGHTAVCARVVNAEALRDVLSSECHGFCSDSLRDHLTDSFCLSILCAEETTKMSKTGYSSFSSGYTLVAVAIVVFLQHSPSCSGYLCGTSSLFRSVSGSRPQKTTTRNTHVLHQWHSLKYSAFTCSSLFGWTNSSEEICPIHSVSRKQNIAQHTAFVSYHGLIPGIPSIRRMLSSLVFASLLFSVGQPSFALDPFIYTNEYDDPLHPLCERRIKVAQDGKTFHYSGTAVGPKGDPILRGCTEEEIQKYKLRQGSFDGYILDDGKISAGDGIHEGVWEPAGSVSSDIPFSFVDGIRWNDGNKWTVKETK